MKKLVITQMFLVCLCLFLINCNSSSKDDEGCSNGSDCDKLAGSTYSVTSTAGGVTTVTEIKFNTNGNEETTNTHTGSGAPADCSSSGTWTLSGTSLGITIKESTCSSDKKDFKNVYEFQQSSSQITLTQRWLHAASLWNGAAYKNEGTAGCVGSWSPTNYSDENTALTLTDDGNFTSAGDYNQSGTWVESVADFTCDFNETLGSHPFNNTLTSVTIDRSTIALDKQ